MCDKCKKQEPFAITEQEFKTIMDMRKSAESKKQMEQVVNDEIKIMKEEAELLNRDIEMLYSQQKTLKDNMAKSKAQLQHDLDLVNQNKKEIEILEKSYENLCNKIDNVSASTKCCNGKCKQSNDNKFKWILEDRGPVDLGVLAQLFNICHNGGV